VFQEFLWNWHVPLYGFRHFKGTHPDIGEAMLGDATTRKSAIDLVFQKSDSDVSIRSQPWRCSVSQTARNDDG
jgi:hypothetical protein